MPAVIFFLCHHRVCPSRNPKTPPNVRPSNSTTSTHDPCPQARNGRQFVSHSRRNPNGRRFFSMARWERSTRTRTGCFIPWKDIQATRITRSALEGCYPRVPRWFKDYEVSKQFFAELPPVLTCVGSYLLADPESGYWAVFLTEWACRVATTPLWEVYDTYRLFNLPRFPRVRA